MQIQLGAKAQSQQSISILKEIVDVDMADSFPQNDCYIKELTLIQNVFWTFGADLVDFNISQIWDTFKVLLISFKALLTKLPNQRPELQDDDEEED